jgi:hypothetical protein
MPFFLLFIDYLRRRTNINTATPKPVSANVDGSGQREQSIRLNPMKLFMLNSDGAGVGFVGMVYWKIAEDPNQLNPAGVEK